MGFLKDLVESGFARTSPLQERPPKSHMSGTVQVSCRDMRVKQEHIEHVPEEVTSFSSYAPFFLDMVRPSSSCRIGRPWCSRTALGHGDAGDGGVTLRPQGVGFGSCKVAPGRRRGRRRGFGFTGRVTRDPPDSPCCRSNCKSRHQAVQVVD